MRSKKPLILTALVLLIGIVCALSCVQTLPSQFQVSVFRVDDSQYEFKDINGVRWLKDFRETEPRWVDIDETDSTNRTTLFPGSKFVRTVAPQKIGFEGQDANGKDVYKIYSFDGSAWSRMTDLTKQTIFDGRLNEATNLYAYYTTTEKQKAEVELHGDYNLAQYVQIIGSLEFKIRLTQGYTFNTEELRVNASLPEIDSSWGPGDKDRGPSGIDFPRVPGLTYQILRFEEDNGIANAVMVVGASGTPQIATETANGTLIDYSSNPDLAKTVEKLRAMQVVIPEKYIHAPEGKGGFAHLETRERLFASCKIIPTPLTADAQTIELNQYEEILSGQKSISIKMAEFKQALANGGTSISRATFNRDYLAKYIGFGKPITDGSGIKITTEDPDNNIVYTGADLGLTYTLKSLEADDTQLVVEITGIPNKSTIRPLGAEPTWPISIQVNSIFISGSTVTKIDETNNVDVSNKNTNYIINPIKITTPSGSPIKTIVGIRNVDTNGNEVARRITVRITTGAKFDVTNITKGEKVPDAIIPASSRVEGFEYTFDSFPDDNKSMIINITGAPANAAKNNNPLLITIPHSYIKGGDKNQAPIVVNEDNAENNYVYYIYTIKAGIIPSSIGYDNDNPFKSTEGIFFGGGEGEIVTIQTSATRLNAEGNEELYDAAINYVSTLATLHTMANDPSNPTAQQQAASEINRRLHKWFTALERVLNNSGDGSNRDIAYEIVSGASQASMSNTIGVRISGVSNLSTAMVNPDTVKITIPYSDILGGLTSKIDTIDTNLYYKNYLMTATVVDSEVGFVGGSENTAINGNTNELISQNIKIQLENAQFSNVKQSDLEGWFASLISEYLADPLLGFEGGEGEDYIIVKVNGRIKNDLAVGTKVIDVIIPKECIKGAANISDVVLNVYYKVNYNVEATVKEDTDGYYGSATRPIEGIRYVNLGNGDGVPVYISLENGEFNQSIFDTRVNNPNVAVWFKDWNKNGIINPQYDIKAFGKNYVVVLVKGALTKDPREEAYQIGIGIPASHLNNVSLENSNAVVSLSIQYKVTGGVSAELDNTVYVGTASNPLVESKYVPFDKNIRLSLNGAKFKTDDTVQNKGFALDEWFADLKSHNIIINPEYTVLAVSDQKDKVTINIKGALVADVSESVNSITLAIKKENIDSPLTEDVPFDFSYRVSGVMSAEVIGTTPYVGSRDNPMIGVQYMPLGDTSISDTSTNIIRINLTNAAFKNTINKGTEVTSWFKALNETSAISKASYVVHEVGTDRNWVTVKIDGSLNISPDAGLQTTTVKIDYKDLNLYVPVDMASESVEAGAFYYKTSGTISIIIDENSSNTAYRGSKNYPIQGVKQIKLGSDGNGVLIHLLLSNTKFVETLDDDVTKWFIKFKDLKNPKCTILDGGKGKDYAFILVEGALDSENSGLQSSTIVIEASALEGNYPVDIEVPVFYQIITELSATIEDSNPIGHFFGTAGNPLSAITGVGFGNGDGVQMRIRLQGGTFAPLTDSIVTEWFKALPIAKATDNGKAPILLNPTATIVKAEVGSTYIDINVKGTLTNSEVSTAQRTTLSIPKEYIKDAILTSDLQVYLYYQNLGVISASLDENSLYYGTPAQPLTGIRYMNIGGNNPPLVKVNLKNGKFSSALQRGDVVTSWFEDLKETSSSLIATIDTIENNASVSSAVVRLTGAFTGEVSSTSDRVKIRVSSKDIAWYLTEDPSAAVEIQDYLYYRVTGVASGEIKDIAPKQYAPDGTTMVINGTRFITLNNGIGYTIRINLENAMFSSAVDPSLDKDVSRWFTELSKVMTPDSTFTLLSGGVDQNYVQVNIKGSLTTVSNNVKVNTVYVHIPPEDISGYLVNDLLVPINYMVTSETSASLYYKEGLSYYGSEEKPVSGIQYMAMNGGEGEVVRIRLENAKFKENTNNIYSNENLALWFSALNVIDKASYELVALDPARTYIDIRIKGTLTSNITEVQSATIVIPKEVIDGSLQEDIGTELYYQCSGVVSASLDSGVEYIGASTRPITSVKEIAFNEGRGVLIRINLSNAKFNDSIAVGADVSSWFTAFSSIIATPSNPVGVSYIVEEFTPFTQSIKIRIRGSLVSDNVSKTQSADIQIPNTVIDGSLKTSVVTPMYYRVSNIISAYVENNSEYRGGEDNPIEGIQNVDINGGNGVNLKISLVGENSRFAISAQESSKAAAWFTDINQYFAGAPNISIVSINDEKTSIVLNIKGALAIDYDNEAQREKNISIVIPARDIENATFVGNIATFYAKLRVTGKVSYSISTESAYYGSQNNPVAEILGIPLNGGQGYNIKILLNGTTFKFDEFTEAHATMMFGEFRELANKEVSVIAGGSGSTELVLNVKGELTFDPKLNDQNEYEMHEILLTLPKDLINWHSDYVQVAQTLTLYSKLTGVPSVSIEKETDGVYYGSQEKPIEGVQYVPLNNSKGFEVKLNLSMAEFNPEYFKYNTDEEKRELNAKINRDWFTNFVSIANRTIDLVSLDDDSVVLKISGEINTRPESDGSAGAVELLIPSEAMIGSVPVLREKIYYRSTGVVSLSFTSQGSSYFGNEDYPIEGIQYKLLGNNGNGVIANLKLENSKFIGLTKDTDISSWFKLFNGVIVNKDPNDSSRRTRGDYKILDFGDDFIMISIKGALTSTVSPRNEVGEFEGSYYSEVKVPQTYIYGNLEQEELGAMLYYRNVGKITGALDGSYDGYIQEKPIQGQRNIALENGNGAYIRIVLENATFNVPTPDGSTPFGPGYVFVADSDNYWFDNLDGILIGAKKDDNSYGKPVYTVTGGGNGQDYVVINIKGAFNSAAPSAIGKVNIQIPNHVLDSLSEAPLDIGVYIKANDGVTAKLNQSFKGAKDNELSGVQHIMLGDGAGQDVRIELSGGTFNELTNDNVTKWFDGFDVFEGASYTILSGGKAGDNYVIVTIRGAFNVKTSSSAAQFSIKIDPSDIQGAHFDNPVVAELYYKCDKSVEVTINSAKKVPLDLVQYINLGDNPTGTGENTDGITLKYELQNATFNSSSGAITNQQVRDMFEEFLQKYNRKEVDEINTDHSSWKLNVNLGEVSSDGKTLTVRLFGHAIAGKEGSDLVAESETVMIPAEFINNAYIETDLVNRQQPDIVEAMPTFEVINHKKDVVKLEISADEGFYGSVNKPLTGLVNTPLGAGGQGQSLRMNLSRAKFTGITSNSQSLNSIFNALKSVFAQNIACSVVGDSADGTSQLDVRISGTVDKVSPKNNVLITVPYQYIKGADAEFGDLSVNIFYEGIAIEN